VRAHRQQVSRQDVFDVLRSLRQAIYDEDGRGGAHSIDNADDGFLRDPAPPGPGEGEQCRSRQSEA